MRIVLPALVGAFTLGATQEAFAERVFVNNVGPSDFSAIRGNMISQLQADGHTVTVSNDPTINVQHTSIDPVNGFDWVLIGGNGDRTPSIANLRGFLGAGGYLYLQTEVSCCTGSAINAEAILRNVTLEGNAIELEPLVSQAGAIAWVDGNCSVSTSANAAREIRGVLPAHQVAVLNGSTMVARWRPDDLNTGGGVVMINSDINLIYGGLGAGPGSEPAVHLPTFNYFFPVPGTPSCSGVVGCGNGIIEAGEQCDDGNASAGDGCGADCLFESIDECAQNLDNCSVNATCNNVDLPGTFTCTCLPGFEGDGVTCNDIDECALNLDNCSANAACINLPGTFSCDCNDGFIGDGVTCTDPDADNDGVCDGAAAAPPVCLAGPDNCVNVPNPNQADGDNDGIGDLCESDVDDDGVFDSDDNCVNTPNPLQENNDGDAQGDACDPDDDNDEVPDVVEDPNGNGVLDPGETDPFDPDTDGDGILDGVEDSDQDGTVDPGETDAGDADTDDDGIADGAEDANQNGLQDDGETDAADADSDEDGLQDGTELGFTEGVADPDGAGPLGGTGNGFIPDGDAGASTTDPLDADTDDGGVEDGAEDTNENGVVDDGEIDPNNGEDDIDEDPDQDGLTNDQETEIGTDPNDADSDNDGILDGEEEDFSTDPLNPDSDGDGLQDGTEVGKTCTHPDSGEDCIADEEPKSTTDPNDADTDDGGVSDGDEDVNHNGVIDGEETDPNEGSDDVADDDLDDDGLTNDEEETLGTDPLNPDTDGDGLTDGTEVNGENATDPLDSDSDDDGLSDGEEDKNASGSVNDGETDPNDPDTDDGGVNDGDEVNLNGTDPLDGTDDIADINAEGNGIFCSATPASSSSPVGLVGLGLVLAAAATRRRRK